MAFLNDVVDPPVSGRHKHVVGWVPIAPVRGYQSWAWGCVECHLPVGDGPGEIRWALELMAEEDISLWDDF